MQRLAERQRAGRIEGEIERLEYELLLLSKRTDDMLEAAKTEHELDALTAVNQAVTHVASSLSEMSPAQVGLFRSRILDLVNQIETGFEQMAVVQQENSDIILAMRTAEHFTNLRLEKDIPVTVFKCTHVRDAVIGLENNYLVTLFCPGGIQNFTYL